MNIDKNIGLKFGDKTILAQQENNPANGNKRYSYSCICGRNGSDMLYRLKIKTNKCNPISCRKFYWDQFIGHEVNGRIILEYDVEKKGISDHKLYYIVKCYCGKRQSISASNLLKNKYGCNSCAQVKWKNSTIINIDEYRCWKNMIGRCFNPKTRDYHSYGGRGVTVCDKWINSFDVFFEDMGKKPDKSYQIDRIDVNGNYESYNCRWVTPKENANNRRNKRVKKNGINNIK